MPNPYEPRTDIARTQTGPTDPGDRSQWLDRNARQQFLDRKRRQQGAASPLFPALPGQFTGGSMDLAAYMAASPIQRQQMNQAAAASAGGPVAEAIRRGQHPEQFTPSEPRSLLSRMLGSPSLATGVGGGSATWGSPPVATPPMAATPIPQSTVGPYGESLPNGEVPAIPMAVDPETGELTPAAAEANYPSDFAQHVREAAKRHFETLEDPEAQQAGYWSPFASYYGGWGGGGWGGGSNYQKTPDWLKNLTNWQIES